jgi:hypothetical protein
MVNKVKFIKDSKEANDVYIGRGSKWGNPFIIGKDGDRELVISKYAEYLVSKPELMRDIKSLKDKNLVCFCSPKACHGDVLKRKYEALYKGDTK